MTKKYCDYCGKEIVIEVLGKKETKGWDIPIIKPVGRLEICYGGNSEYKDLCGDCLKTALKEIAVMKGNPTNNK